jgi:hypothetical protein
MISPVEIINWKTIRVLITNAPENLPCSDFPNMAEGLSEESIKAG